MPYDHLEAVSRERRTDVGGALDVVEGARGVHEAAVVALTGEPVVDYALRFKSELGWTDTWVSASHICQPKHLIHSFQK